MNKQYGNDFYGVNGMLERSQTASDLNTFNGMDGMDGILDGLGKLWDGATEMIGEGATTLFNTNVDSYVTIQKAEAEARAKLAAQPRPAPQPMQTYAAPAAGGVMRMIKDQPAIAVGLGLLAFKMFS